MALPKSGKSGSNVLKLDKVRKKRLRTGPADSSATARTGPAVVALPATADCESLPKRARRRGDTASPAVDTANKKTDDTTEKPKRPRVSNRRFDRKKVDRIKGEIARDEYRIDFLQVADKFIEHERYS